MPVKPKPIKRPVLLVWIRLGIGGDDSGRDWMCLCNVHPTCIRVRRFLWWGQVEVTNGSVRGRGQWHWSKRARREAKALIGTYKTELLREPPDAGQDTVTVSL